MPAATWTLDGTDVSGIVLEGSVTHQHNRPSFSTVRIPSFLCSVSDSSRLKVTLDGSLDFHGALGLVEDEGDENTAYTSLTFVSPSLLFEFRPARDGEGSGDRGDFSKPTFIDRRKQAPQMLWEILDQSINGGVPADAEGPMGIQLGTFASGGADLSGAPADWPMTIAEIIAMLGETGELDVIETPIDSGGNMAMISAYNGDYGFDRTSSVRFGWKAGERNVRHASRTVDYREICNKLWIYLGPRVGTKKDPQGDQHWEANVTGTSDFSLHDPPASSVLAAVEASRSTFYPRMVIRIFDGDGVDQAIELYKRWWLMESWLRARPRTFVTMTPERGIAPTFRTGDLIHCEAGSSFRAGFSGTQRVMEYTWRTDTSGVVELGAPLAQAGAPAVVSSYDADGI